MISDFFFGRLRSCLGAMTRRLAAPRTAGAVSAPAHTPARGPERWPTDGVTDIPQRSLEELRADLARLRASSKERHASVSVRRPQSFDDEVFADFVAPATPAPGTNTSTESQDDYARTVYVPRGPSRTKPAK